VLKHRQKTNISRKFLGAGFGKTTFTSATKHIIVFAGFNKPVPDRII